MHLNMTDLVFLILIFCGGYVPVAGTKINIPVMDVENNNIFSMVANQVSNKSLCEKHLFHTVKHLNEMWALKMFDSSSKIPTGLLSGRLNDLGDFDECLAVSTTIHQIKIQGKYCLIYIHLDTELLLEIMKQESIYTTNDFNLNLVPPLKFSICVPSTCDQETLNSLINKTSIVQRIEIKYCQTIDSNKLSITTGVVITFAAIGILVVIMIVSTCYDIYLQYYCLEVPHVLLVAFSLYTNTKKLFSVKQQQDRLPCINGIRVISSIWVVYAHGCALTALAPMTNLVDLYLYSLTLGAQHVIGATVVVDTFFLMTGLFTSYIYLIAKKTGIKFSLYKYYLHRYLRLTPSLVAVVVANIFFLRFLTSGPTLPPFIGYLENACNKYWWMTLLFVQNNARTFGSMCIPQSWYLALDMQICWVSPLVLLPLGKWPKKTIYFLYILVIVSMIYPFMTTYINHIPVAPIDILGSAELYLKKYYYNVFARFGPVVVGFILGYFIFHRKRNEKMNKILNNKIYNLSGWFISICCMSIIVFAPNNLSNHEYDVIEASAFNGFHRVAWAIAVSWIIYACVTGHGGIVNSFLSMQCFQVLGRLTYSIYLLHVPVLCIKFGYLRTPIHYSKVEMIYRFCGDFGIIVFLSFFWTLVFESPGMAIEKLIFKNNIKPTPDITHL